MYKTHKSCAISGVLPTPLFVEICGTTKRTRASAHPILQRGNSEQSDATVSSPCDQCIHCVSSDLFLVTEEPNSLVTAVPSIVLVDRLGKGTTIRLFDAVARFLAVTEHHVVSGFSSDAWQLRSLAYGTTFGMLRLATDTWPFLLVLDRLLVMCKEYASSNRLTLISKER